MSGEYGGYHNGYMYHQMHGIVGDFKRSRTPGAEQLAQIAQCLYEVSVGICYYEECDSDVDYPIMMTLDQIPRMEEALSNLKHQMNAYRLVMEEAVKEYIKKESKKNAS